MKKMKKLVSVLLTLVMVLAMSATVFAATVTIPTELNGHTFKAYQIFTGTQAEGGSELGDVEWGTGISKEVFLAALKGDTTVGNTFKDCVTAADVAAALGGIGDDSDVAKAVAKLAYANKTGEGIALTTGENTLAEGYYLIVDVTTNVSDGDAYNAALLQVTDDIEITVKTDAPEIEKKVKENVKYTTDEGYGAGYNDVADYNIGDEVPFAFYSKVPDMIYFDTYKYVIHDKMSAGLTLDESSIAVTIGSSDLTKGTDYTVNTTTDDDCTFEIVITDLKAITAAVKDAAIKVDFKAKLNADAEIGLPGNPNEVHLEYSNKPDDSASTGKTPVDKVIVFTYELDTTKVDGKDNAVKLEKAEFKLKNAAGKWATVDEESKITGWVDEQDNGSTLTSGADGLFKVIGLDNGTYYLKETKAPAGYNLLTKEIEVVITATTSNGQTWTDGVPGSALTKLEVTADGKAGTGDTTTGIAGITVVNNKGAQLPETGGIGTTIFYIVGTILVVGAGILLITKKRMNSEK